MNQDTPVIELKGVGEKTQKLLEKLNIRTVGDLLSAYPRDYEVFGEPVKVSEASAGTVCAVYGAVSGIPNERRVRKLSILNVNIADSSGSLQLTFYNMPFLKKTLRQGGFYIFRGLVQTRGASRIMEQPKIFSREDYAKLTDRLVPRYSLTKGLTNQSLQKYVKQALSFYEFGPEYFSEDLLEEASLVSEREALETVHFPQNHDSLVQARRRLVFDEFFSFLFLMRKNKEFCDGLASNYRLLETADTVRFLEQLPFPLTRAQQKVWQEIKDDVGSARCMNRLVQGDVGSGKTIVAVLALLMTAANGYQGALMAPTEVLAMQHFETIQDYVKQYDLIFRPVLLVGSMSAKEKREAYGRIASGEANLIIGTHALIQEKVQYKALALVVTDEQHRFGVRQREHLAEKGENPHILVMSATPIPRTLAIILYGDLHISVIDELPANRLPIKNCVVNTGYRPKAYRFIAGQVEQGRQVYVICPQVEGDSEDAEGGAPLENVVDYTEKLKSALPAGVQVAYLHGKMRPADKNRIMEQFASRKIDVLVSTTVIEVGINVPNATVMMVENAERFGLAQLHQLRGRVGRGEHQSYCIFISASEKEESMERLQILNKSNDGFFIASEDLKLRGPGELFGIRQSGEFSFRIGDIYSDASVLKQASKAVDRILSEDPGLEKPANLLLKQHLEAAAGNHVDFRSI
ncbi:ATP-dependent DNA helicase RecG [Acetatifactor aquisgranensis]|uniref:ATP-dependent DNA helicase RecG n=1 Tax=Acetatifactor aquisgranensis TaxID=2941233 RepID=UPI00203DF657|nr:ATP-dependent DNA helicase RecG [Acetatifactor aquisgranensis]MCI8543887.1 ATP-dependent DNA helicase RecG [Lachnospiraceae bacterium]